MTTRDPAHAPPRTGITGLTELKCPNGQACDLAMALVDIRNTLAHLVRRTEHLDQVRMRQAEHGERLAVLEQREDEWAKALSENTRQLSENTDAMHQMARVIASSERSR